MTTSHATPVRVLVKGASTVNWVSFMGGPRTDLTFPRVIEARLLSDGRPCEVRAITMPGEQTSAILRTWQREVLGYSPDVIVLVYGHAETIHLFLPQWLERHAHSPRARARPLGQFYRRFILRPLWMSLARLQAKIDSVVDPNLRRNRPRRVVADLELYISQVQKVGSPLVIVFELLQPTEKCDPWFPGMKARIRAMNETIAKMVTRVDQQNVRYFRVSELVDEYCGGDIHVATPDGFHYSPQLHRLIGNALGAEIGEWADTQPHLSREASVSDVGSLTTEGETHDIPTRRHGDDLGVARITAHTSALDGLA